MRQPGYVQTGDRCADCGALDTPVVAIVLIVTTTIVLLVIWYLARINKGVAAATEALSFSVPLKIYFATCQILGTYSLLLSEVLFEPLKGFFDNLSFATDLAELFSGFGITCADHDLGTFKSRLLMSALTPIALSFCVAAVFTFRVLSSHPSRVQALQQGHATLVLLLFYLTLPSTSTLIFKAYVRDSRSLGINEEQYLIVDYAGKQ